MEGGHCHIVRGRFISCRLLAFPCVEPAWRRSRHCDMALPCAPLQQPSRALASMSTGRFAFQSAPIVILTATSDTVSSRRTALSIRRLFGKFPEIPALLDAIGPRLVVPMHYKTPRINLNIQPLERFLDVLPGVPVDRPGTQLDRGEPRDAARAVGGSSCSSTRGAARGDVDSELAQAPGSRRAGRRGGRGTCRRRGPWRGSSTARRS